MSPRAWLLLGLGAASPLLIASSCDGTDGTEPASVSVGATGGGAPFDDGGSDADAQADAQVTDSGDAAPSPVLVGITANAGATGDAGPTEADLVEARLTAIAAGARAATVARRWRDLDGSMADVASEAAFFVNHGVAVVFELLVVDRAVDARPDSVAMLPWKDPVSRAAMHATLDALFAALSGSPSYLVLGRQADVYLDTHPSETPGFEAFALDAIVYAKTKASRLHTAVGMSLAGVTSGSLMTDALLAIGDRAAISYFPGLEQGVAAPVSSIPAALDALIAHAKSKPIALDEIGYPSDPVAMGAPESQRAFYESLWGEIATRRQAFELVNVFELHDLSADACAALAVEQGHTPEDGFSAFYCSTGVWTSAGAAKPAWSQVLVGTATFASP